MFLHTTTKKNQGITNKPKTNFLKAEKKEKTQKTRHQINKLSLETSSNE